MANTTTCTKCGTCYEAGSEEQANEPERLCDECAAPYRARGHHGPNSILGASDLKVTPPWLRPRPTEPTGPLVPDPEALERHAGEIAAREAQQARDVRPKDGLPNGKLAGDYADAGGDPGEGRR